MATIKMTTNQKNIDAEIKVLLADNKIIASMKKDMAQLKFTVVANLRESLNKTMIDNLDRIECLREDLSRDANQD